jgi:hypothetical protein
VRSNLKYLPGGGHAIALAVWQIAQPANKETVYAALAATAAGRSVTIEDFNRIFDQLVRFGLIWEGSPGDYIVTPLGAALANTAVAPQLRDKRRFFLLNRRRKFEVGA